MKCRFCDGECIRFGRQSNGVQRYICKHCRKRQQAYYSYRAYDSGVNDFIVSHIKEAVSIRGIARLLKISTTTLMARILEISKNTIAPNITAGDTYEVDEIKTFVGCRKNHVWVAYALNRDDKSVASFSVGPRTNETLGRVLNKLINAKCIYTDRLRQYKTLIHSAVHKTTNRGTNHIERHNLTIRTHVKRSTRRTICFSRSSMMLYAVLKIYFWGKLDNLQNLIIFANNPMIQ